MSSSISSEELVEVTSYAEVTEAFRAAAALGVVTDDEHVPVRGGTVLRIDGSDHLRRRRALNALVLRDEHARLRSATLVPAVDRGIRALGAAPDPDGYARADLVALSMRWLVELVATMIGIDAAATDEGVDELVRLQHELEEFPRLQTQLRAAAPPTPGGAATVRHALERFERAKREFAQRFYQPSLERRLALVERSRSGEVDPATMPVDYLTIVARAADARLAEDVDLALREAIVDLLHAGTGTTAGAVAHMIDELARHVAADPGDAARLDDPEFLAAAASETLRLHVANPAEVRRAREDLTLSGGTLIRAGQLAALRTGIANRDPAVFGPDVDLFDPRRRVAPGVNPYGVAFGAGPHMCYGLPLAIGNRVADGNIVAIVSRCLAAGIEPDPDRPSQPRPGFAHADLRGFEHYWVRVRATGARS